MSHLKRNGYATSADLHSVELCEILSRMENFQLEFLAATATIWSPTFAFTGDALYQWSRQLEYPYAYANIDVSHGRVLDAGSGFTFFPFFLAQRGFQVVCCDTMAILDEPFRQAQQNTQLPIKFERASITHLTQPDNSFDVVCCVSVLEHMPPAERRRALREFARILHPGGRLITTCDISLGRDTDIQIEDFASLLGDLCAIFEPVYPLEMRRPPDLLTTEYFQDGASWRLPWRPQRANLRNLLRRRAGHTEFHALAVVGLTFAKPR